MKSNIQIKMRTRQTIQFRLQESVSEKCQNGQFSIRHLVHSNVRQNKVKVFFMKKSAIQNV